MNASKIVADNNNLDTMLKIKMPAIGIDLGGTKIMASVVNSEGIISEPIKVDTPRGPENILNKFLELIEHFKKNHVVAGVGIATAGIVDGNTGTVVGATGNIPGWTGTPVKKIIESKTLLPVHVENDANAAAYAEANHHKLQNKPCIVVLTIGTGIGGGILVNGQLLHGANWGAGHCGHIKLSIDNKRLCTCGLFDCYEAYASGTGLHKTAKEILNSVSVEQSVLVKNLNNLKNADIFAAAANNDIVAKKIIDTWHRHLAAGMATLANALNPNSFVLGGGLCKLIDFALLSELVIDQTIPHIGKALSIHQSELGDTASMIGAAQLVLDKLAKVE